MRYMAGCRCRRCRRGNAVYERRLARNRLLYGPNDLVSSARVLSHLRYLQEFEIGHRTVAKHARVGKTGLAEIIWYGKKHLRRRSEARILAVQPSLDTLPRSAKVPAIETVQRIRQLTLWGYPQSLISREGLGNSTPALQIRSVHGKKSPVMVRTAVCMRDFYALVVRMRSVWQRERGPIPLRFYVYWKRRRGRRPRTPLISHLELRPFASNYDYNYLLPQELKSVIGLAHRLKRIIRRQTSEQIEEVLHAKRHQRVA